MSSTLIPANGSLPAFAELAGVPRHRFWTGDGSGNILEIFRQQNRESGCKRDIETDKGREKQVAYIVYGKYLVIFWKPNAMSFAIVE